MSQTRNLILRKAVFADWPNLYQNVWSREETARFMLWEVTHSEEDAKVRIERTITFQQKNPNTYIVCEKATDHVIGFAGMIEVTPGVYEDCGIALGPEFVGKGYGKEILTALVERAFVQLSAEKFICSCRSENEASRRLQLSCGFTFSHTEDRLDPRTGRPYTLEFYEKTNQNPISVSAL